MADINKFLRKADSFTAWSGATYEGDIAGRFGWRCQRSNDANYFGQKAKRVTRGADTLRPRSGGNGNGWRQDFEEYRYALTKADLPMVKIALAKCQEKLDGEYADMLQRDADFWATHSPSRVTGDEYRNAVVPFKDAGTVDVDAQEEWFRAYEQTKYRRTLGTRIVECIETTGRCHFIVDAQ